ncbi:MAG: acetolactate synthase large subunit, partial [Chlamydiota bacterium]|nr:acetolactate synthase large subunit [Chlamydiota bacterium]
MKASQLFIKCLENEGVEIIFGIPGEENLDLMDALQDSPIRFVTTRHEQGAAFMADVYGRLTGKAGLCFSTLGPGATNLVTGVADANMDRAPVVAIAGQAATTRLHKESHQVLDSVGMFDPITKYSVQILEPEIIPEVIRKAFKTSQTEKPGCCFIDLPENIAGMDIQGKLPLRVQKPFPSEPNSAKVKQAAEIINKAAFPIILAGNGVIRGRASKALCAFAEKLQIPVTNTFMAKGAIPFSHPLALGTVGLQANDYISCGLERADLIICVGYDMVEYPPSLWHKFKEQKLIHIDTAPAEVDEDYIVEAGIIGDIGNSLNRVSEKTNRSGAASFVDHLKKTISAELELYADDEGFPVKPQRLVWDLSRVLRDEDMIICDVGAHKMWMARLYPSEQPNTCIISNGFASMGIALPGAI